MKFYRHKNEKIAQLFLLGVVGIILYLANGLQLNVVSVSTLIAVVIYIIYKWNDRSEYTIIGQQLEIKNRSSEIEYDISKILHIEKYSISYGGFGAQSKYKYFMNYDGTLVKLRTNLTNDSEETLPEVLESKFDIIIKER